MSLVQEIHDEGGKGTSSSRPPEPKGIQQHPYEVTMQLCTGGWGEPLGVATNVKVSEVLDEGNFKWQYVTATQLTFNRITHLMMLQGKSCSEILLASWLEAPPSQRLVGLHLLYTAFPLPWELPYLLRPVRMGIVVEMPEMVALEKRLAAMATRLPGILRP
jgi:hypothetical protein